LKIGYFKNWEEYEDSVFWHKLYPCGFMIMMFKKNCGIGIIKYNMGWRYWQIRLVLIEVLI